MQIGKYQKPHVSAPDYAKTIPTITDLKIESIKNLQNLTALSNTANATTMSDIGLKIAKILLNNRAALRTITERTDDNWFIEIIQSWWGEDIQYYILVGSLIYKTITNDPNISGGALHKILSEYFKSIKKTDIDTFSAGIGIKLNYNDITPNKLRMTMTNIIGSVIENSKNHVIVYQYDYEYLADKQGSVTNIKIDAEPVINTILTSKVITDVDLFVNIYEQGLY